MLSNVNVDCLYLSAIRDEHAQHTVPYAGRVPVPGEVWVTLNLRYVAIPAPGPNHRRDACATFFLILGSHHVVIPASTGTCRRFGVAPLA